MVKISIILYNIIFDFCCIDKSHNCKSNIFGLIIQSIIHQNTFVAIVISPKINNIIVFGYLFRIWCGNSLWWTHHNQQWSLSFPTHLPPRPQSDHSPYRSLHGLLLSAKHREKRAEKEIRCVKDHTCGILTLSEYN